jgi:hypothetical protein
MTEIERALEWFANMACDESANACAVAARAELAEKDARIERLTRANENLKSALRTGIVKAVELELAEDALSGTPTTAKLVPVEKLRELEHVQFGPVKYGCAICRELDSRGHAAGCWLAAALREETVPPKPTPPPLRVFREGDMPKKADRAS